jgi:hypothetical protein
MINTINKLKYNCQTICYHMLLTPEHRRSNRRRKPVVKMGNVQSKMLSVRKANDRKATYDLSLQCDEEFTPSSRRDTRAKDIPLSPISSAFKCLKLTNDYVQRGRAALSTGSSAADTKKHCQRENTDLVFPIYRDVPYEEGYDFDKEHYLASSRYSSFVDEEIVAIRLKNK